MKHPLPVALVVLKTVLRWTSGVLADPLIRPTDFPTSPFSPNQNYI